MAKNIKTIIRAKKDKENPYALVSKQFINDKRLSWKARGLGLYLISKPDDWTIMVADLINQSPEGEKAVRSGLHELMDNNYMQHYPVYKEGRIDRWEYALEEIPFAEEQRVHLIKELENDEFEIIYTVNVLEENRRNRPKSKGKKLDPQKGNLANSHQKLDAEKVHLEKVDVENAGLLNNDITNNELIIKNEVVVASSENSEKGLDPVEVFNENITKLKPIQFEEFNQLCEAFGNQYILTIIEYCASINTKSFAGFRMTLEGFLTKNADTPVKVLKQIGDYRSEKRKARDSKSASVKKISTSKPIRSTVAADKYESFYL